MDDRYLYRAKRIDTGEWVEGNLVWSDDVVHDYTAIIIPTTQSKMFTKGGTAGDLGFEQWYRVDPSTICRCTRFEDKNGKLIWENDICRRVMLPTKRIKTNFKIAYVPYKCCLSAIDLDGGNVTFLSDYINNQYEVEVIGNIFDNPELLEV